MTRPLHTMAFVMMRPPAADAAGTEAQVELARRQLRAMERRQRQRTKAANQTNVIQVQGAQSVTADRR